MKINWGTGIVLAFIAFISFILFFVIRMSIDNRVNHDLVTEEYYSAELGYQKEIDAETNASKREKIKIEKTAKGLLLKFPDNIDSQQINGTISFYRPSNKNLDFELAILLSENQLLIPSRKLLEGRWDIKIFWAIGEEKYLQKERLTY